MSDSHSGNVVPAIVQEEHNGVANAKKVVLKAFDGVDYPDLSSEAYGAKDALSVILIDGHTATFPIVDDSASTLVTAEYFSVGTSTVGGPAGSAARNKVLFVASPDNANAVYVLTASTATYQLGIRLDAGDVFGDSAPYAYTHTYWLRGGAASQEVTVRQWL